MPDRRFDRRSFLARGVVVAGATPAAWVLACGGGRDRMGGDMPPWMMSGDGMMGPGMREDMQVIHRLLRGHGEIERHVENIADGIRSRTTSEDPHLADLLRTHVQQMKERVERGDPIRRMDPVFREIFEHHTEIEMDVKAVRGGVVVIETSDNPQVELLIRQHAHRAVSEFVAAGMRRARRPTPLPAGYRG